MDELLKLAAEAGQHVSAAEDALEEGAFSSAREAVDQASDALAALRDRWPAMSAAERALVGKAAGAIRQRLDAVVARLPAQRTLSEGTAESDPEQDEEPEAS
jgi:acyl-CoA reductase-like NAD-dependent aldehyde dehydrogenase